MHVVTDIHSDIHFDQYCIRPIVQSNVPTQADQISIMQNGSTK